MVISYSVLAIISNCYPQLKGRSPTCYSPVCHSVVIHFRFCASTPSSVGHCVRLACLRHAASVHPEPGSNSSKKIYFFVRLNFISYYSWLKTLIDVLLSFQRSMMLSHPTRFLLQVASLIYQTFLSMSIIFFNFFYFLGIFFLSHSLFPWMPI